MNPRRSPITPRDALLRAGVQSFAKLGYAGATVQKIARAAKMNTALVSYYFKGKEGLYRACMEEFGRERLEVAERILTSPSSKEDARLKIRLWMEEILVAHVKFPDHTTILHRDLLLHWEGLREVFSATFLKAFKKLIRFVSDAQEKHLIRKDLGAEEIAGLIWGSIVNTCRVDRINQDVFGKTIASETYRTRILNTALVMAFEGIEVSK